MTWNENCNLRSVDFRTCLGKVSTGSNLPQSPFSRSLDRKLDTLVGGKKVDKGDGHAERDAQSVRLFAEG